MSPLRSAVQEAAWEPLCFLLGRNQQGRWVVQEQHGRYGGLFVSESAAIRYARFEAANRGAIFEVVAEPFELK